MFGPKGHNLDLSVYICSSLGGSFVGWMQVGLDKWLLAPVPIIVIVTGYVMVNEHRIISSLKNFVKST
ncbi:MAG: hypothetical protein AABZ25_09075 [Nitrospirota bacterium]